MAEQSKPGKSTGISRYTGTGKGSKGYRPNDTTQTVMVKRGQPLSNTAHIPEGLPPTGSALLAIIVALQDFQEVMKTSPRSWITSSNGKIYMCIESTGRLAIVDGKPYLDAVPVDMLLEKQLEKTGKDK